MQLAARWTVPLALVAVSAGLIALAAGRGSREPRLSEPQLSEPQLREPRLRTLDEIEEFVAMDCFDSTCHDELHRIHEEGLRQRPIDGDPGVIDDETWRRCVDACGLYGREGACGMPAFSTAAAWLLFEYGAADAFPEFYDTYDLHHARAIIHRREIQRPFRDCLPAHHAEVLGVYLSFVIAPDGRLERIERTGDPALVACVARRFEDLSFPPSLLGDRLRIDKQFHFAPVP